MRRSQPLRRTRLRRRPKRADKPMAQGRRSLTLAEYRAEKAKVRVLSGGRCEVTYELFPGLLRCPRRADGGPHHVIPRSQGGTDDRGNLIDICWGDHAQVSAPYRDGRLVIVGPRVPGPRPFACRVIYARDKWESRRLTAPNNGGQA